MKNQAGKESGGNRLKKNQPADYTQAATKLIRFI